MITGIQDFYYNVSNMKKAVGFYTEGLGLKLGNHADEYWTSLTLGHITIGLHSSDSGSVFKVPGDAHGAFGGGTLTLKSNNIKEDRARIEKNGGKILGEEDQPWGHMLVFEDLDGNVLKLMNPKH